MKNIDTQIREIIDNIKGDTNFAVSGTSSFIIPGLNIEGIGEIGFPLQKEIAEKIISKAHQAPFGKGAATIMDTTIRNTWEIDAAQIKFTNIKWKQKLNNILNNVKGGLSLEEEDINASFYKLLLYEAGGFFKPHKDSEKEKGMFATLVINLPSAFEGGELIVEFDNQKIVIDFSSNQFDFQYAAFYADCTHQLLEVKSGYRICLVYNLLKQNSSPKLGLVSSGIHTKLLTPLFKQLSESTGSKPFAYLLEHQYTPENFSLTMLKRNDNLKTQVIIESARKAGLYVNVGLLTHYLMGEIEDAGDYDYYSYSGHDVDPESCEMGEVLDEQTDFNHWVLPEVPALGEIEDSKITIINKKQYESEEPLQKEAEGFMGNYGMTTEFWYHHAAILFCNYQSVLQFVYQGNNRTKLDWLNYFLKDKNIPMATELLLLLSLDRKTDNNLTCNYDTAAALMLQLKGEEMDNCIPLLCTYADLFAVETLTALLSQFDKKAIELILDRSLQIKDAGILLKWLQVIDHIESHNSPLKEKLNSFYAKVFYANDLLFHLDEYISKDELNERIEIVKTIIMIGDKSDMQEPIQNIFASQLNRRTLYEILHPAILECAISPGKARQQLIAIAINKLETYTNHKPQEPNDWVRSFPNIPVNSDKLKMLKEFLSDPGSGRMIYAKAESERSDVQNLIDRYRLDISYNVLKQGRPYQLVLTKNMNSYLNSLKHYTEDMKMKEELLELSNTF